MIMSKRTLKPAITVVLMSAMLFSASLWSSVQAGGSPKSKAAAAVPYLDLDHDYDWEGK